ncbi:hypothetical protein [Streptomyces reticuli]|uniref:hypothetical protein n=1 Tax=Streptomyces reticuli TaxID=1926 RepID=UPI00073DD03C|nr:hypothetical protein [Streptomyces sp. SID7810]CUW31793.1 hypothetical protein TUE45_06542 [Streptomyces reticuli]
MAIPGNFLSEATSSMDPVVTGWTPQLNCTISKGSGGRVGDGCLAVRSTAAGEMQARIVGSVLVTAGTLYYAFADASGATVPERIGIRWLNKAGTVLGTTWSLTTMTASATWHRISVAGQAPVGTTRAQVILSSTPAAGGVYSYYENVYFGLPIRSYGNLFPFSVESTEIDATGWSAEVNATISRQVPVTTWSADWYYAGGHTLAMTVAAAGNASVATVDRPTVTPGTEYLAYAYLQPPVLSAQAWLELRFYDSAGNQVGSQRAYLAPVSTGMHRQLLSATAPSNAVTCGIAAGLDGASAGQVLRLETVVVKVAPEIMAGTVIPYANGSFEQDSGGWVTAAGAATLARSTPWGVGGYYGSYGLAISSATASSSTIRSPQFTVPDAPGLNWRAAVVAKSAAGAWSTVTVKIHWYDGVGGDHGASTGTVYALPAGSWYQLITDAVAPAGTVQAAVEVVASASATSSVMYVDAVALWQVLPQTAVQAVDADGYIKLTLRELPVGDLITVYRVGADSSRTLVRGEDGLINQNTILSDAMVIEDHEAPLNTAVSYYIELYSTAGALASTRASTAVMLTLTDTNTSWLKDPGNPQRNVLVMVAKAPDWQRPIEQASFVVRGRRNKVVLSGRRQGLEGDLAIWTRSEEERKALHLLLDSGNTLLWQAAPGMGVDDMYVHVAQITESRVGGAAQEPWRAWTLPLVEADMPVTTGVNGARGRTWQDILTEFATWQDVLDTYATWEDVLLDRRKG